jgi:hypothetical protein
MLLELLRLESLDRLAGEPVTNCSSASDSCKGATQVEFRNEAVILNQIRSRILRGCDRDARAAEELHLLMSSTSSP